MPRFIVVALFILLFSDLFAQVYHYETGKTIPVSKPGQIIWKPGVYLNFPADFGTLVVLENNSIPKSSLINLPIIRIHCFYPDSALEPIFVLNGGPGESNIQTHLIFSSLLEKHDIILMGYRGVDGSMAYSSNFYKQALFADSLSMNNYQLIFNLAVHQTISSLITQRIDIQGYSLENVINDIEVIRLNENYSKISFIAYSYGTMLAQLYEKLHPNRVEKMALIGARPFGNFKINDALFQQQVYSMFKNFKNRNQESDSSNFNFEKVIQSVINDSFLEIYQLNPVRFRIFLFSQFYSLIKADELFSILADCKKTDGSILVRKYHEFYQNYPNIEMADIFLKKQHYFDYTSDGSIFFSDSMAIVPIVNQWYTPVNDYFLQNKKQVQFDSTQVSTLFICAQYDIAAPICLINEMRKNRYLNSEIKTIERCGHLDLFYEQKPQLDSLIYNYFCPQPPTSNF